MVTDVFSTERQQGQEQKLCPCPGTLLDTVQVFSEYVLTVVLTGFVHVSVPALMTLWFGCCNVCVLQEVTDFL